MLPRVLEPEAMDTPEESLAYDAMDHSAVNERFVRDFLEEHGTCRGGVILDLGTGTAQIPIALCRADPGARVLGIDLAASMLAVGWRNVEKTGLTSRIKLLEGDAKRLALPPDDLEAVVSNSLVHHLADPGPTLAEMARLVAPGGTLFVRDLARPESLAALDQLVRTYAGSESSEAQALFRASLHAALTRDEVRELVEQLGLPASGVNMTSDRHWTWSWRRPA